MAQVPAIADHAPRRQKHKVLHCEQCDTTWIHYFDGPNCSVTDAHGCIPCPQCKTPTLCLV